MTTKTQEALQAMSEAIRKFHGHAKTVPNLKLATAKARRALCIVAGLSETMVFLVWRPPTSWDGPLEQKDFRFDVVTRRSSAALRVAGIQLVPFEWECGVRVPREDAVAERWLISDRGL